MDIPNTEILHLSLAPLSSSSRNLISNLNCRSLAVGLPLSVPGFSTCDMLVVTLSPIAHGAGGPRYAEAPETAKD